MPRSATLLCIALLVTASAVGCTREKGKLEKHIDQLMAAEVPINGGISRAMAKACDDGDARACADLGMAIESAMRQAPQARVPEPCLVHALYQRACDADDAKGCYALGRHFTAGTCTKRDALRGRALLEKSCEAEFIAACSFLEAQAAGGSPYTP